MPAGKAGSTRYTDDFDGPATSVRISNTGRDGRVTLGAGFFHLDETFYETPRSAPKPKSLDESEPKRRPRSRGTSQRR